MSLSSSVLAFYMAVVPSNENILAKPINLQPTPNEKSAYELKDNVERSMNQYYYSRFLRLARSTRRNCVKNNFSAAASSYRVLKIRASLLQKIDAPLIPSLKTDLTIRLRSAESYIVKVFSKRDRMNKKSLDMMEEAKYRVNFDVRDLRIVRMAQAECSQKPFNPYLTSQLN